jgi:hypothetical protein
MKLWLDDERPAPTGWRHVTTAQSALIALYANDVTELSLDHDLGDDEVYGTGYDVLLVLEEYAYKGEFDVIPATITIPFR